MIYHQKKELTLRDNSEELFSEETGGLPFMCYYDEGRLFTGHRIPWHWHDRIEVNYVETGSFRLHSTDRDLDAFQGDVVFINKNVLHAYELSDEVFFPDPVLQEPQRFSHETGYAAPGPPGPVRAGVH